MERPAVPRRRAAPRRRHTLYGFFSSTRCTAMSTSASHVGPIRERSGRRSCTTRLPAARLPANTTRRHSQASRVHRSRRHRHSVEARWHPARWQNLVACRLPATRCRPQGARPNAKRRRRTVSPRSTRACEAAACPRDGLGHRNCLRSGVLRHEATNNPTNKHRARLLPTPKGDAGSLRWRTRRHDARSFHERRT